MISNAPMKIKAINAGMNHVFVAPPTSIVDLLFIPAELLNVGKNTVNNKIPNTIKPITKSVVLSVKSIKPLLKIVTPLCSRRFS